jgi:hypothetical protein
MDPPGPGQYEAMGMPRRNKSRSVHRVDIQPFSARHAGAASVVTATGLPRAIGWPCCVSPLSLSSRRPDEISPNCRDEMGGWQEQR